MDTVLAVRHLTKRFSDSAVALDDVSVEVRRGEVVVLIGPSGSGKSTLLRCVAGLEKPSEGDITLAAAQPVPADRRAKRRPSVGMVFQNFNLYPHLSALENVCTALVHVLGLPRPVARQRGEEVLALVGMATFAHRHPGELSGGQQQRVAIARALALRPSLMLFDEPTSALDPETVGEVLAVIREIAAEGMTMLISTHEMAFAQEVGHRVVLMNLGQVCEESDCASFFRRPATERGREFLRRFSRDQGAPGMAGGAGQPAESPSGEPADLG